MKKFSLVVLAVLGLISFSAGSLQAVSGPPSSNNHAAAALVIMDTLMYFLGGAERPGGYDPSESSLPAEFQNLSDFQREFVLLNSQVETADLVEQTATGSFHAWEAVSQAEMSELTTNLDLAQQAAF